MSEFENIRPYNDAEVSAVLQRLLHDNEFIDAILDFRLPKASRLLKLPLRSVVKSRLKKRTNEIHSVADFQAQLESYLEKVIGQTVTKLNVRGIDDLDPQSAFLFVSNHRDIVMDPAIVNFVIYRAGFRTLRIAIGDNLLSKPFVSDLMRLNKSFIVNRSATAPREKLKAAKLLSKYIHRSVTHDEESVWIAQREGRAKDGLDRTNSAIINMLSFSKEKTQSLSEYIREARIVPVSISYEYDPCDADKARELYTKQAHGKYEKAEHEDVDSIARGITGFKGHVNLSFGEPLAQDFDNTDQVTEEIDRQILSLYQLHPSNCIAYQMLENRPPDVPVGASQNSFLARDFKEERAFFQQRLDGITPEHRDIFLAAYANPVRDKLAILSDNAKKA